MKTLIVTTSYPAYKGHEQSPFVHHLAKALNKKTEVNVICPRYKKSNKEKTIDEVNIKRFKYFPKYIQTLTEGGGIPSNLNKSFYAKLQFPFFMASFIIKTLFNSKKADIIHAQWTLSGIPSIIAKKIYKKPVVLTTRGAGLNLSLKSKISKKITKYILKNCDYITPNNQSHEETIKQLGIKNVKTIPNGIDKTTFKKRDKQKVRKKLKLNTDKKIILFIGWLIPRKGLNYLIDAVKGINCKVLIIGSGAYKKEYKKQIKQQESKNKFKFLGSRSQKETALYLNAADIFVLPSLSEGRPNVVLEAFASGTPTIATDIPGTDEIINNNNSIPVKPKSSEEIKKAILKIFSSEGLSSKLSKNALKTAKKIYSWDDCAEEYIKIYKKVLD